MSQEINLLGVPFERKRAAGLSARVFGAAMLALLTVGLGAHAYAAWRTRLLSAELASLEARVKAESEEQASLQAELAARKKDPALETEVRLLDRQVAQRRANMEILKSGALGSTTGFSAFLHGFARQTIEGVWLTGFDIAAAGSEISIEGRALRAELVPVYIKRLGHEPVFSGRSFATVTIAQPATESAHDSSSALGYLSFSLRTKPQEARAASAGNLVIAARL